MENGFKGDEGLGSGWSSGRRWGDKGSCEVFGPAVSVTAGVGLVVGAGLLMAVTEPFRARMDRPFARRPG